MPGLLSFNEDVDILFVVISLLSMSRFGHRRINLIRVSVLNTLSATLFAVVALISIGPPSKHLYFIPDHAQSVLLPLFIFCVFLQFLSIDVIEPGELYLL